MPGVRTSAALGWAWQIDAAPRDVNARGVDAILPQRPCPLRFAACWRVTRVAGLFHVLGG